MKKRIFTVDVRCCCKATFSRTVIGHEISSSKHVLLRPLTLCSSTAQVNSEYQQFLSAISEVSIRKTSAKKKSFATPVFSLSHVVDQRNVSVNKNCFHITVPRQQICIILRQQQALSAK
ncbi:retinoblastoma-binding protein 6 [Trichinella spiralis]|uniref:retinoblastoma-binding protein 6 n=1 Tax=Trichinella spiralis TaxID=6334 RepID=UPI0001EFD0B7|nr:retinoblastoma-binding protein 6 [Trichinella spiralis]